ncbi:diaminopimelate epimerase [Enterobacteriaceae endosymbiont of Donacia versicolorea]|uniref:diaminopimelate epimerase n=1 Tax=Enterobacteriaceae endosymbiont of Donacia versicolorea TaxID=2675788 RepID=UPI00144942B4|nr:diaminopimelate epimerase [Enterobacteriaceae endosymbiont of Donacia versicolorea]QJC32063.1 diaminopimelate epimerase [Enterobacteriaceae endosymbiont of Donacia versicolorea]
MKIKFTKMHALSNDFIIINNIKKKFFLNDQIIKRLSDRYTGIGFDQLLLIKLSSNKNIDFHYQIFNCDGSEVEQCGNGVRCIAQYLRIKKLICKKNICLSTKNRIIYLNILNEKEVLVNMGIPLFNPQNIPFLTKKIKKNYKIYFQNKFINFNVVSLGNPHCVIQVKKLENTPVSLIGSFISKNKIFPEKINVIFMEYIDVTNIKLRIFERGVGETNACGSGACAAVAIGIKKKILSQEVKVNLIGGIIKIFWKGNNENLFMQGDANYIYDGEIIL